MASDNLTGSQRLLINDILTRARARAEIGAFTEARELLVLALDVTGSHEEVLMQVGEVRGHLNALYLVKAGPMEKVGKPKARRGAEPETKELLRDLPTIDAAEILPMRGVSKAEFNTESLEDDTPLTRSGPSPYQGRPGGKPVIGGPGGRREPASVSKPGLYIGLTPVRGVARLPEGVGSSPNLLREEQERNRQGLGERDPRSARAWGNKKEEKKSGTRTLLLAMIVAGAGYGAWYMFPPNVRQRTLENKITMAQQARAGGQFGEATGFAQEVLEMEPGRLDMKVLMIESMIKNGQKEAAAMQLAAMSKGAGTWQEDIAIARLWELAGNKQAAAEAYFNAFTKGGTGVSAHAEDIVKAQESVGQTQRAERIRQMLLQKKGP